MHQNEEKNSGVRKRITDPMFTLLEQKSFSEITVTEIVQKAGVARVSYYRYFDSKESVIQQYIADLRVETQKRMPPSDGWIHREDIIPRCEVALIAILKNRRQILGLYRNGFGTLLLESFNLYAEMVAGDMPYRSIDRYKLYFLTGALFNMVIRWLESGASESPLEMAHTFANYMSGGCL